jgi:hypothetical protein
MCEHGPLSRAERGEWVGGVRLARGLQAESIEQGGTAGGAGGSEALPGEVRRAGSGDGGRCVGVGEDLTQAKLQLGNQEGPVPVAQGAYSELVGTACRAGLAAVLGEHAARQGGARCDHTQRGRSRELLQARHARLGRDNIRKGHLGFGEHDEQAGRPDSVVSQLRRASSATPAASRCCPRIRWSDTSATVASG